MIFSVFKNNKYIAYIKKQKKLVGISEEFPAIDTCFRLVDAYDHISCPSGCQSVVELASAGGVNQCSCVEALCGAIATEIADCTTFTVADYDCCATCSAAVAVAVSIQRYIAELQTV